MAKLQIKMSRKRRAKKSSGSVKDPYREATDFLDSSEEDEEEVADSFVLHQRREKNSRMRWGGNHSSFRQCKKEYDRLDESAHYLERARLNMEALLAERRGRTKVEATVVQGLRKILLKGTPLLELRKRVIRAAVEAKETLTKKQSGWTLDRGACVE